jgi:hypothetical protein
MKKKNQSVDVSKISIKDSLTFDNVSSILEKNAPLIKINWWEWKKFPSNLK